MIFIIWYRFLLGHPVLMSMYICNILMQSFPCHILLNFIKAPALLLYLFSELFQHSFTIVACITVQITSIISSTFAVARTGLSGVGEYI